jgi:hypothetical protein
MEIKKVEPLSLNNRNTNKQRKRKRKKKLQIFLLLSSKTLKVWLIPRLEQGLVNPKILTSTQTLEKAQKTCLKIPSLLASISWMRLRMTNMDGVGSAHRVAVNAFIGTCYQKDMSLLPRSRERLTEKGERQRLQMRRPLKRRSRRKERHCHQLDSHQ